MVLSRRRWWLMAAALFAAVALIAFYALVDETSGWMPRCPVKMLTGLECPGCGSQRALHALLNGHLLEAWHYNALAMLAVPVGVAYVAAEAMRERHPQFYAALTRPAIVAAMLIAIVVWTVWRNL